MVCRVGIGLAAASGCIALFILVIPGCGTATGAGSSASGAVIQEPVEDPDVDDSDLNGSPPDDVNDSPPDAGANVPDASDPFRKATSVSLDGSAVSIEGQIGTSGDVDIYEVGPLFAGDRIVVDVQALSDLDAVVAIFDDDENLIYANDDRAFYAQLVDPKIDTQLRRDCDRCYVAVASSFASGTAGDYALTVTISSGDAPPEPDHQLVYYNFDGADDVHIGSRPAVFIPSFEGSLVAPRFAGQTDELIARLMDFVREDYIGLNVQFLSSRESAEPAEPHTTVHFGAYDPDLLGVADNIDEYNELQIQQAVVFVDTFQAFLPLDPSLDEMAQAIANVAAHETGHLLGLQHTHDPRGIMDVSANLRQMLGRQAFLRSPLDVLVFPVGHQDAAQSLVEAVGGDLSVVKTISAQQIANRLQWYDEGTGPAARESQPFSTCLCSQCDKAKAALKKRDG